MEGSDASSHVQSGIGHFRFDGWTFVMEVAECQDSVSQPTPSPKHATSFNDGDDTDQTTSNTATQKLHTCATQSNCYC